MAPSGLRRRLKVMFGRQWGAEMGKPLSASNLEFVLNAEGEVVSVEVVHGGVLSCGVLRGRARAVVAVELDQTPGARLVGRADPLDDAKVSSASGLADAERGLRARCTGIEGNDSHLPGPFWSRPRSPVGPALGRSRDMNVSIPFSVPIGQEDHSQMDVRGNAVLRRSTEVAGRSDEGV